MKRNSVFVIDNYDSFTYNLVHILRELGLSNRLKIVRNDSFDLKEIEEYQNVLLSPGPGIPKNAGLMPEVIKRYASQKNILGVCLGHQAIGEAFGGELFNLQEVFHGIVTNVKLSESDQIFDSIPNHFKVCRYHSWVVRKDSLPDCFSITSEDESGTIMSMRHHEYNMRGIQFHPESVMTEYGKKMIDNWIQIGLENA